MTPDDLVAYLDGECSDEQAGALEQALEQDEGLRRHLAALVRQRMLLAEVCAGEGARAHARTPTRSASSRRLRAAVRLPARRVPLRWLAAAAGLLLAVGLLWSPARAPMDGHVLARATTVGAEVSCRRAGQDLAVTVDGPLFAGDRLSVPALTFADLRFADGSTVSVAGDSALTLAPTESGGLRLEHGSLTATVAPQPAGRVFAIATSHGTATVIGTRFTLTATRTATHLQVEHGRVRLAGRDGDPGVVIAAGGSAHVGGDAVVARADAATAPTGPLPGLAGGNATSPADQGLALLPADPWSGASVATGDGLGMPRELISVSGQPFKQALRVATPAGLVADPRHTGEYALRVRVPTIAALHQGDAVLATLWLRSGDPAQAQVRLVVEDLGSEPQRSLSAALGAGQSWRKVELPFRAAADAGAGTIEAQLWLGRPGQTIELAGLQLTSHGDRPLHALVPQATYDGRAADAPWRAAAESGIAAHRRTRLAVRIEDSQGRPVPGAEVAVRLLAPALRFGTAVVAARLLGSGPDDARYRDELLRRFTSAVPENVLKWAERERDAEPAERAVAWLAEHHLPVRGHTLVWPRREQLPADLRQQAVDPQAIGARLQRHVEDTLAAFRGRLAAWDVVNDPYSADLLLSGDGRAQLRDWFATARRIDPQTPRFLNLYGVLDDGGADQRRQDYYLRLIAALQAEGVPLDGLGLQCHQDRNLTPPARLAEVLARFAACGLPIHISEFDVDLDDEALQADYTRDALTVFASQPAVRTVVAWGFWAGDHHRPQAAMQRADWTLKPNGVVWDELVLGAWSGAAQDTSDAQGACRLTSMRGELEISARQAGRSARAQQVVDAAAATITLRLEAP